MNIFLLILVIVLGITLVFGFGFLLWITAEILSKFFNIVGFFWSIISNLVRFKWLTGRKKVNQYFYDLGLSKDQYANVVLRDFFNKIMLKKLSIPFGDPDETISWYFAINKLIGDRSELDCGLSPFGKFWAKFLGLFERSKGGHLHVAILTRMLKDDIVLKKHGYHTHPDVEDFKHEIVQNFEKKHAHLF
jgi:hypothetical protein